MIIDKKYDPTQTAAARSVKWTTADLGLFAGDRNHRYELIEGELVVTRAPH